jgi:GWxTD domain-containing protein
MAGFVSSKRLLWTPLAAVALAWPTGAPAQGYPTITPPLSSAAIAESVAVLRSLDAVLRANQTDAAAWHRRGMVSWLLSEQSRNGNPVAGYTRRDLTRMADTSLLLALSYDRNPRHMLTMGQYRLGRSFISLQRFGAYRLIERSLDEARKGPDRRMHAEAAIEFGRMSWRRYDAVANRRFETEPGVALRSITAAMQPNLGDMRLSINTVRHHLYQNTQALTGITGEIDYVKAEDYFREAYSAAPDDPRTFRQLAMLLAERDRWPELTALAQERTLTRPTDAWGWMALGLALRRRGELLPAEAAFASWKTRATPGERSRLDHLARVLAPRDTARHAALSPADQERDARTFWHFADPLWSRDGNDAHTEFLARVAFAELRWTVKELGVRGVDSDRGRIHVRFGPPDFKAQIWPTPGIDDIAELAPQRPGCSAAQRTMLACDSGELFDLDRLIQHPSLNPPEEAELDTDVPGVTTIWAYNNGWMFFFRGQPTYATSYIPVADRWQVDTLISQHPSRWANVAGVSIEPMPTVVARFRRAPDSADVVVAIDAPLTRMRDETAINTRVRGDFWLLGRDVPIAYHDSTWLRGDVQAWAQRVPAGTYVFRTEVTSDAATFAGRTAGWVVVSGRDTTNGFPLRGYGMSDVLLGIGGEPTGTARRWSDVQLSPTGGTIPLNGDIAMLWENYELEERDGAARYDVTVTVEREYALMVNRIRARIVGGAATLLGVDRVAGRVVIRFEREVPFAPVLVDHVVLSMDGVPAGEYRITTEVRDRVSGRTASRQSRVYVRGSAR